jgi:hypothetical protein
MYAFYVSRQPPITGENFFAFDSVDYKVGYNNNTEPEDYTLWEASIIQFQSTWMQEKPSDKPTLN